MSLKKDVSQRRTPVTISIHPDTLTAADQIADRTGRSRSQLFDYVMQRYIRSNPLDHRENDEPTPAPGTGAAAALVDAIEQAAPANTRSIAKLDTDHAEDAPCDHPADRQKRARGSSGLFITTCLQCGSILP